MLASKQLGGLGGYISAVAAHTAMQVPKPALHTGRRKDGHPKSETCSSVT